MPTALFRILLITASLCACVLDEVAGAGAGAGGAGGGGGVLGEIAHIDEGQAEGSASTVLGEKGKRCGLSQGGCAVDILVEAHPMEFESTVLSIVFFEGRKDPDSPPGDAPSLCLAATPHRHAGDDQVPQSDGDGGLEDAAGPGCTVIYWVNGAEIHREVGFFEGMPIKVELRFRFVPVVGNQLLSVDVRDGRGEQLGSGKVEFVWKAERQNPTGSAGAGKQVEMAEMVLSELAEMYEGKGRKEADSEGNASSRVTGVKKLDWEGLECSLPRQKMRVYELNNVKVLSGQLMVLAEQWATRGLQDELAILRTAGSISAGDIHGNSLISPMDVLDTDTGVYGDTWCKGGGGGSKLATAVMLMGVRTGTVVQFGHFLWDYLVNLHRLIGASGERPGRGGCCQAILHADSIESLFKQEPRKYYELVAAVTGAGGDSFWKTLQETEDGTCLPRVILGFGTPHQPFPSTSRHSAPPQQHMARDGAKHVPPLALFKHVPSPTTVFWGERVLRTCVHRIDRVSF